MSNNEELKDELNNENFKEVEEVNEYEEEKGPSGISLFFDNIRTFLNKQNKTLVFGIVGIVVLITGYFAYLKFYKQPREEKALSAIFKAEELFANDSFAQVIKIAPKIADNYSGTKAGEMAAYMAGVSYLNTGDFKKAVTYLEKVDFKDHIMKVQVIGLLGDAHIELNDKKSAISKYESAYKASKTDLSGLWWGKKLARVYESENNWEKALKVYESIKKDYAGSEELGDIEKFIARAQAKVGKY